MRHSSPLSFHGNLGQEGGTLPFWRARMMLKFPVVLFGLGLSALPVLADAPLTWERDGSRVQTVIYACDSAMDELSVAYFTAPDAASFAAVQIAGVVHAMVQEKAASGQRFVDVNDETGYRLHAKGDLVLLSKLEPDHTAGEQPLAECRALQE